MLNQDNNYYWGEWVTGLTRKTKFTKVTWTTMLIWLNGDLNDWETLIYTMRLLTRMTRVTIAYEEPRSTGISRFVLFPLCLCLPRALSQGNHSS